MLVRDRGETWQLVRQPDHADLSGQLAAAWGGGEVEPPRNGPSLVLAATRHDDGWAVFDRRPAWDPEKAQPRNFLDVPIRSHLAFYRACIQVVTEEDAYAGLMVSMHGAGIYNGRYGTQPSLSLTNVEGHEGEVRSFVDEQEATHPKLATALAVSDEERWVNYKLLQIYDRLSLSLCLREWESSDASSDAIEPCPVDYAGAEAELRIEPLGPWRVRLAPYPFGESPARFTLVRKLILKAPYGGNEDFRKTYLTTRAELVEITIEGG
jgi:Protein of unknown function (DUF3891)